MEDCNGKSSHNVNIPCALAHGIVSVRRGAVWIPYSRCEKTWLLLCAKVHAADCRQIQRRGRKTREGDRRPACSSRSKPLATCWWILKFLPPPVVTSTERCRAMGLASWYGVSGKAPTRCARIFLRWKARTRFSGNKEVLRRSLQETRDLSPYVRGYHKSWGENLHIMIYWILRNSSPNTNPDILIFYNFNSLLISIVYRPLGNLFHSSLLLSVSFFHKYFTLLL